MHSDLDVFRASGDLPDGVPRNADASAAMTGQLVGVDVENRQVQVQVGESLLWLPAAPGLYDPGVLVRLSRTVLDGGRLSYCEGPLGAAQEVVAGEIMAINTAAGTLTVLTLGSTYDLLFSAGTYQVGMKVHVLRSPSSMGRPIFVLGPQGNFAGTDPGGVGGGGGNPGQLVQRQAVILPQWSGSWRAAFNRWDSWNTDRFGGASTLWQGNKYGSGPMTGLATYGDQILALGAQEILSIAVTVTGAYTEAAAPGLRPAGNASRPAGAPTVGGNVVSGGVVGPDAQTVVQIAGADLEGFRQGAFKGLATAGGTYGAFRGTSRGDGMALTVQYMVVA